MKYRLLLLLFFVSPCLMAQNTFMGSDGSNGYSYVDLGLPSGLKWATCNVGATKPKEIGYLFAWGEVEPKEDYSLGNYKWYNASDSTYTKYYTDSNKAKNNTKTKGIVDNKVVLEKKDDAATVNMGGHWRMPTKEEFEELISCCKLERKKKGYKLIGPNGNSIFFPAAGFRNDGGLRDAGYFGYYWSSSLRTDCPDCPDCAWYVNFFRYVGYSGFRRYYGQSVRAVCE